MKKFLYVLPILLVASSSSLKGSEQEEHVSAQYFDLYTGARNQFSDIRKAVDARIYKLKKEIEKQPILTSQAREEYEEANTAYYSCLYDNLAKAREENPNKDLRLTLEKESEIKRKIVEDARDKWKANKIEGREYRAIRAKYKWSYALTEAEGGTNFAREKKVYSEGVRSCAAIFIQKMNIILQQSQQK